MAADTSITEPNTESGWKTRTLVACWPVTITGAQIQGPKCPGTATEVEHVVSWRDGGLPWP